MDPLTVNYQGSEARTQSTLYWLLSSRRDASVPICIQLNHSALLDRSVSYPTAAVGTDCTVPWLFLSREPLPLTFTAGPVNWRRLRFPTNELPVFRAGLQLPDFNSKDPLSPSY
ncbi:uncharacterized protein PITG_08252 [Phytophthora infestans T30-4]|uniref:Uncharacterized protein n=1 Tax=Phytophthora infestans (strain T30-4) TaxID=403677 RepID=D0NA70_PHYIT|nr:uncharacterized protein PITG_08252 [Phytophthora infestans T30-4]EEY54728.1 hypothetical protein PITG_08252 [Phytophthora infestans T30-4]|eukprot:XP_002903673.1 hypothetical protein PITG_08252 [Phytophthora infestans T30-4]